MSYRDWDAVPLSMFWDEIGSRSENIGKVFACIGSMPTMDLDVSGDGDFHKFVIHQDQYTFDVSDDETVGGVIASVVDDVLGKFKLSKRLRVVFGATVYVHECKARFKLGVLNRDDIKLRTLDGVIDALIGCGFELDDMPPGEILQRLRSVFYRAPGSRKNINVESGHR